MLLRMSLLAHETFVAVGRRTGARWIVILHTNNPAKPKVRATRHERAQEVAALGGRMYLILPTGEILTQTERD